MGASLEDYARVFAEECRRTYPVIDALEARCGYAVPAAALEEAARVLACPVKAHPPNWQHGRVLYALLRQYLETHDHVRIVDIGTAKGFSALLLQWALDDSGKSGLVTSIDVVHPLARVERNTVAECDGWKTVPELLSYFRADRIELVHGQGSAYLQGSQQRIHFAFVDGKHSEAMVGAEGAALLKRQQVGDVIVFDDVHLSGVRRAVEALPAYQKTFLALFSLRQYAIARRV